MSDTAARTEARRRAAYGEPAFKVGDLVHVSLWHSVCWMHSDGLPDGLVGVVEDWSACKTGVLLAGNGKLGIRCDSTPYNQSRNHVMSNEFCCHQEHWTLLRGSTQ